MLNRPSLFHDYIPIARVICRSLLAKLPKHVTEEDAEAAALVGLWKASERYQEGGGAKFTTYMDKFVRGAVWDWCRETSAGGWSRTRRKSPHSLDRWLEDPDNDLPDLRNAFAEMEALEMVAIAMQVLSLKEFKAVLCYYLEGRSMTETGQIVGMTGWNVSLALRRSLAKMRERLERGCS